MDYVPVLQVQQCLNDLCYDNSGSFFAKKLFAAQLLVKISVLAVFENNIDALRIVEIPVKPDDVWVVESPLDLQLPLHL